MAIRAVFFDLYNTLATFSPSRQEVQAQAARDFGMELDHRGVLRGYVDADHFMTQQNAVHHIARLPEDEQHQFFARYEQLILKGAGHEVDLDTASRVWRRVREIPYHLAAFDDAAPTLSALKERGLTIGLISNIYQDLEKLCHRLGIAPYLDFMVSSQSAGAEKPSAKIFRAALEQARVEAADALHVGDQYGGDVEGARKVGIHPLLLDRDGLLQDRYLDVDHIGALEEVLRWV